MDRTDQPSCVWNIVHPGVFSAAHLLEAEYIKVQITELSGSRFLAITGILGYGLLQLINLAIFMQAVQVTG